MAQEFPEVRSGFLLREKVASHCRVDHMCASHNVPLISYKAEAGGPDRSRLQDSNRETLAADGFR
jgi:hypothetical protein